MQFIKLSPLAATLNLSGDFDPPAQFYCQLYIFLCSGGSGDNINTGISFYIIRIATKRIFYKLK